VQVYCSLDRWLRGCIRRFVPDGCHDDEIADSALNKLFREMSKKSGASFKAEEWRAWLTTCVKRTAAEAAKSPERKDVSLDCFGLEFDVGDDRRVEAAHPHETDRRRRQRAWLRRHLGAVLAILTPFQGKVVIEWLRHDTIHAAAKAAGTDRALFKRTVERALRRIERRHDELPDPPRNSPEPHRKRNQATG
jgi:DNA-directed RNA polymerase specialized sigma24 family protein